MVRLSLGDPQRLLGTDAAAVRDRQTRGGPPRPRSPPHRRHRARHRSGDGPAMASHGIGRSLRWITRCGCHRPPRGAENLARRRVQDPRAEVVHGIEEGRRPPCEAAALGADAGLHAPRRHHAGDVRRRLQRQRRDPHRADPCRRRRRRASAGEGETGDRRAASAIPHRRRSRLVAVPLLPASRPLSRRPAGRAELPDMPSFDAGRRRLDLRTLEPEVVVGRAAARLPLPPVRARSRSRPARRRRRRLGGIPPF